MSTTLGFHAFEPGGPALVSTSGSGVFVNALLALLQAEPALDVRVHWSLPIAERPPEELGELWQASRRALTEAGRLFNDRSGYQLIVYPVAPLLGGEGARGAGGAGAATPLPRLAARIYTALSIARHLSRRRLIVAIRDLLLDRDAGLAVAEGRPLQPGSEAVQALERALLRGAHLIVLPAGLRDIVVDRYGVDDERCRPFRRYPYPPQANPPAEPPFEFEPGSVNFFYSGGVEPQLAANFREILRSIRNAPDTRLHVCGPGREAVRKWLAELAVPNVRHYGQLGLAQHDWLAGRCDVGLILDSADNPYHHRVPSLKYSGYVANGLAVLSTDLRQVAASIREDGVGQAMPIRELSLELLRWATKRPLWAGARERARALAATIRSGSDHKDWVSEIAAS